MPAKSSIPAQTFATTSSPLKHWHVEIANKGVESINSLTSSSTAINTKYYVNASYLKRCCWHRYPLNTLASLSARHFVCLCTNNKTTQCMESFFACARTKRYTVCMQYVISLMVNGLNFHTFFISIIFSNYFFFSSAGAAATGEHHSFRTLHNSGEMVNGVWSRVWLVLKLYLAPTPGDVNTRLLAMADFSPGGKHSLSSAPPNSN